nr:uncharacterized protein LOC129256490 [Lytechinus pictus]
MASNSDKVVPQGGVSPGTGGYQNPGAATPSYPNASTSYPHPNPPYQHTTQYPYPPVAPQQPSQPLPNFQPPQQLPNFHPDQVTAIPFHASVRELNKSTSLAVILCVPILGMLGLHHFYLNRPYFGYIYAFTLGLFALGWIIDWFRIKSLVKKCNQETREAQIRGYKLYSPMYPGPLTKISLCDAYMLWLPPIGLFGFYQYYLGRSRYGLYHTLTFGRCGLGWLLDFCRLPAMVRKANANIAMMKKGIRIEDPPYSVCDAYTLAFPLGIFGLHHFYLGNTRRGFLFLCTAGVFGLGWLADLFQMPLIVSEANKNRELNQRLVTAEANNEARAVHTTVVVTHSANSGYANGPGDSNGQVVSLPGQVSGQVRAGGAVGATGGHVNEPPPVYKPEAGEGESVMIVANDHGNTGQPGFGQNTSSSQADTKEKKDFLN